MTRILAAFIFIVSTSISLAASLKPTEREMAVISKTVDCVFSDSFVQAFMTAAQLEDTVSGRPIYHLLYASILHAQMTDGEDYSREKEFMSHIDASTKALDKWIDRNPDDAWGYFFLGSVYGYKSIWQGQKGSWLKSLLSGLKAKGRFFDALERDSRLYDCYTGIGSYHYWASIKLRKFFPFLSDNRRDGLGELKLAMDSSYFSSKAAAVGYAWALLNEKKYSDAIKVTRRLSESTGNGRNALWLWGSIYWSNGNLAKAAESYGLLIESLERTPNQNYYNLIFCRYRRGVCLYGLRKYAEAEQEFRILQSYTASREIKDRHEKTYIMTKDYLARIKKARAGKG